MTNARPAECYRFGVFEADITTGELRRQGVRVKLNAQPFQVLSMMLGRPGELLSREEISRQLWPDGTFVDYEHGVNAAINRIREALGDSASSPRFVETLARRGYRFVAPVQRIAPAESAEMSSPSVTSSAPMDEVAAMPSPPRRLRVLSSPEELPEVKFPVVQALFVLLQLMYVAFYVGALANLAEIDDLLAALPFSAELFYVVVATAAALIPVRAFAISAAVFQPPEAREKLLKVWRFLLPLDTLWALAPFLLLHHISFGLALSCTALLLYAPFAQRSLVLMGAGARVAKGRSLSREAS